VITVGVRGVVAKLGLSFGSLFGPGEREEHRQKLLAVVNGVSIPVLKTSIVAVELRA